MKLLLDQNISFRLVSKIKDVFPNVEQVRKLGLEDSSDEEIWRFCKENGYTIVTFDSDFYDLSVVWGQPPKIVWIRTGNLIIGEIERLLRTHAQNIERFIGQSELACLEIIGKPNS